MNCTLPICRQHFADTAFTTKTECAGLFNDIRLRVFNICYSTTLLNPVA